MWENIISFYWLLPAHSDQQPTRTGQLRPAKTGLSGPLPAKFNYRSYQPKIGSGPLRPLIWFVNVGFPITTRKINKALLNLAMLHA